jgi:hypothetical protein
VIKWKSEWINKGRKEGREKRGRKGGSFIIRVT